MPYEIIDEGDGLYARLYGFVAPFELMACNREVARHANWPRHRFHIFDHSDMDSDSVWAFPEITSDVIAKEDCELYADRDNLTMVALVAKSRKMREIFRDYATQNPLPGHVTVGIFSGLKAARQWIHDNLATPSDAGRQAACGNG